jgi:3,4-dihydroxy-9,10-secoandrosta-1,3,5(10)-triene-9,17-dione 4,5-dioxygenase
MQRSPVISLGYVVVESSDLTGWRDFATGVLGMSAADGPDGELLLRMDDRVARIIVRPASPDRPAAVNGDFVVGWECSSEAEWRRCAEAIEKAGVDITPVAEAGWSTEAFGCVDAAGVRCEFFYGGKVDPAVHFVSPLGVAFVTGAQGLGHVTISTPRCRESVEFYSGVLDFQVRETKITGSERTWRWAFLSPSEREHSLAVMDTGRDGQLMHILIEVTDLDSVGRAIDRCVEGAAPMTFTLGRHWNDEMVSFYVRAPSGWDVEYGYGGRKVEAAEWTRRAQGGSGAVSLWGHRMVRPVGTLGAQIGSGRH